MQHIFFTEAEAEYMRSRVQVAVHANGLAAQATQSSTPPGRRFMPGMVLVFRRSCEVIRRPWPVLQSIYGRQECPATQS